MPQQGWPKITKGDTFLNTMLDVCSNRHEKSRLRKKLYRYERRTR